MCKPNTAARITSANRVRDRIGPILSLTAATLLVACVPPTQDAPVTSTAMEPATAQDTASSDRNLAAALLFRWWGIFEAPDSVDVGGYFEDLFTDDVYLNMPNVELSGVDAIKSAFSNLPPDNGRSHQLSRIDVTPMQDGRFDLTAIFTYQIVRPGGNIDAGHSSYRHTAVKQPDGTFRLAVLTAALGEPIEVTEFAPSYAINRARGTVTQYLGITDLLQSDYQGLREIVAAETEVHGMFDPGKETHNERGDGVLRGFDEISGWLATRQQNFNWVAHDITAIRVSALTDNTYLAETTIGVSAGPKSAERIDVSLPIAMTLRDDGGRFMVITRIER